MKVANRIIAASLLVTGAAIVLVWVNTASAASQPAAARYYAFIGQWKGQGQLTEPGTPPIGLKLQLVCTKAAAGWAVRCDMTGKNGKFAMRESDLMGVDAVTGKGHWYAVTNQGETHDHLTEWTSANDMTAHYSWVQNGKQMRENITVKFSGKKAVEFRSVVSAEGKEVNAFSAKLKR